MSEDPGVPVLFGGHNLPPLIEIGLTDLPKSGGALAPLAPPGTTPLKGAMRQLEKDIRLQLRNLYQVEDRLKDDQLINHLIVLIAVLLYF